MAWGSVPSGVKFTEAPTDAEIPPLSYLRLKQTRRHLRTRFDPSTSQITRTLYENARDSGAEPVYIMVKEVETQDQQWRTLKLDVITFHETGTPMVIWAGIILAGAIISYFLIQSVYFIATGAAIPTPGMQAITDPNTQQTVIVPQGSYYEYDPQTKTYVLKTTETDIDRIAKAALYIALGLGAIYVLPKVLK